MQQGRELRVSFVPSVLGIPWSCELGVLLLPRRSGGGQGVQDKSQQPRSQGEMCLGWPAPVPS